jgi:hypothetical protein
MTLPIVLLAAAPRGAVAQLDQVGQLLNGSAAGKKSGSKPEDITVKKGTAFGIKLNQAAKVAQ